MVLTTLRCKLLKRISNTVLTVNLWNQNKCILSRQSIIVHKSSVTPSVARKMHKINKNLVEFQDFVNFEASG